MNNLFKIFVASLLSCLLGAAHAVEMPSTNPHLPNTTLHGKTRLRVIVHVYDAALYGTKNFNTAQPYAQPIALSVKVGRAFRNTTIVRQMVKEMNRQNLPAATIASYEKTFAEIMPSVEENDTLTVVYTPKSGWSLWFKGKQLGEWADDVFARAFFDIWLGENTSQPDLRKALLRL
jgi:Chalcone isomerase-like